MLSIVKGPYLQNPTGHSMTVMWETSLPATSRVDVLHAERIHSGHQGNYKQPVHLSVLLPMGLQHGYTKSAWRASSPEPLIITRSTPSMNRMRLSLTFIC